LSLDEETTGLMSSTHAAGAGAGPSSWLVGAF
jgi:hypothetical protein